MAHSMVHEELFFVKQITKAKFHIEGTGRKIVKSWWEGYEPAEETWEPIESFKGSQYAVHQFWLHADCGPRTHEQLRKFRAGEIIELKPVGPPPGGTKKKPGPGRSSVGLITGTRVFALWPENQHYYSGVVQKRSGATNYIVRFDEDGTEISVPLKHMRRCDKIRSGDKVILKTDAVEVGEVREDGSMSITKEIDYSSITLSAYDVEHEWGDRLLLPCQVKCQQTPTR
ncbi:hypothetical protein R3P38DRAFT_2918349 [Favolaschia claudopus]|uniref:DNA repair protein Crb2 Tudor domain-containing protein n=1 Tax=Favolaschia claudopus TaxID=2862362 RepID=A0AAW0C0H5_9AGAR